MLRFLLKRIACGVPILLGVSLLTFATVKMVPGDPVAAILGPNATPQARAAITKQMGLDRAIPIQYFRWLWHCVDGNFSTGIAKQQPVLSLVASAFGNTLIVTAFAGLIAVIVGLPLGGLGVRRPGVSDSVPMHASAVNISLTTLQENSWPQYFGCTSPTNLAHFCDKRVDALLAKVSTQKSAAARANTYAQITTIIDSAAPWLFIVNDRNPRALSPHVHGFIEPKSWFVDLTDVSVS